MKDKNGEKGDLWMLIWYNKKEYTQDDEISRKSRQTY